MRKTITLILLVFILIASDFAMAQAPSGINYQAVLRNTNNQIITNQNVGIRMSILENSVTGTVVFSETHNVTTNAFGVVNLILGEGTNLSGVFDNIDWGSSSHFVKVDVDFAGGSNYQFLGISQLQSVPYALYAERVNSYDEIDGDTTNELQLLSFSNDTLYLSNGNWVLLDGSDSIWTRQANQVFLIDDKVGIGTSNPTSSLHIQDTLFNGGNNGLLNLHGGSEASIMFINDSIGFNKSEILVNAAYQQMQFRHNGGSKLTLHNNGSVSIGTYDDDAKLKVKQSNNSDTTIGVYALSYGGMAVKGKTIATSANNYNNVGLYSELATNTSTAGRAIYGNSYGFGDYAIAVAGESHLDNGENIGVRGVSVSNSNNNFWHTAGSFEARGDYDTTNGVGIGSHYGVRAEAKGGGFNCGVRSFGLSHNNTTNPNYGARFTARANWDDYDGAGQGDHYGVYSEAYGGGQYNIGTWSKAQGSNTSSNNFGGQFHAYSDVNTSGFNVGIAAYADSSTNVNRAVEGSTSSNVGRHNQGGYFKSEGTGNGIDGRNSGVEGWASGNKIANYGIIGSAIFDSQNNPSFTPYIMGVHGQGGGSGNSNYGVHGKAWAAADGSGTATGVFGELGNNHSLTFNQGVDGSVNSTGKKNIGVGGWAFGSATADSINIGIYGYAANADTNYGVFADASYIGSVNYGIFAEASNGTTANYAGFFEGDVTITGNLNVSGSISKASGTFKIDHPLDPENKYLVHSFVESPEMMNVYSGNITTDAQGMATVVLPSYFETVNKDFRYQLTPIGQFAQAIVKEEINGNTFVVQTDKPNVKISWQVTAVRNDRYAKQNRITPEQNKPENEKGKYLHPELYDKSSSERVYPKHNSQGTEMMKKKVANSQSIIKQEKERAKTPAADTEEQYQSTSTKTN
ncbi:MAG: hypothetical protein KAG64_01180 [Bacteroidales bacterium]|nr:hypothetical protein [Bacteroidales bacterium]